MRALVLASQKGGSGKTTVARSLAVAAEPTMGPVVLLDADPQGSLAAWWDRRQAEAPRLARLDGRPIGEALEQLRAAGVGLAVVDTPPSAHPFMGELVALADFVLVPVRPSPDDLGAIGATLDLVEAAGRPFAFVITQAKPRTRLAAEALRILAGHGRVAPAVIHDRAEHPTAAIAGLSVSESDPGGKAAAEVAELWAFVRQRLEGRGARR